MLVNTLGCIKETVRSQDKFGKPIQLTFQNKSSIKSFFGGFLSLCIKFGILSYLIIQLKQVWDLSEIKIIQSIFQRNLLHDDYAINLNEKNFDIALYLTYAGQNDEVAEEIDTYVTFHVFQVVSVSSVGQIYNSSVQFTTATWDTTLVPLIRCTEERMGGLGYSDTMAGLYWCPQYVNFTVQGHYQTNYNAIEIRITYCDQAVLDTYLPGKICKSKEETNEMIGGVIVRLATLTQFADLNAFGSDRIKKTLTVYDSGMNNLLGQAMYFKVSENTVKFKDSIISNTLNNEDFAYINVRLSQMTTQALSFLPGYLGSFLFFMDEDIKISQRTVQTVFDVFAQAGGLLGTLTVFCAIIVSKYEDVIYQKELIKSLYSIFDKKTFHTIENQMKHNYPKKQDKSAILLTDIKSRIPLYIKLKEWFFIKSCFKNKTCEHRSAIIKQAIKKLNKELDVVQLIKAQRDFKSITKLTMSSKFQQLLRFSKQSLIIPKNTIEKQQQYGGGKSIDYLIEKVFKDKAKKKNKKLINLLFKSVNRHSQVHLNENDDNQRLNDVEQMAISQRKQKKLSSRLNLLDFEASSTQLIKGTKIKKSSRKAQKQPNLDIKGSSNNIEDLE